MTTLAKDRPRRKTLDGVVVSDRMNKTRVVQVDRRVHHALYGKTLRRSSTMSVHDEKNESRSGDRVRVMETRPLSKTKRWRLVAVLERARVSAADEAAAGAGAAS